MSQASGVKSQLKISPCTVEGGQPRVSSGEPFVAMINPTGYAKNSKIQYSCDPAPGPGNEKKFTKSNPTTYKFNEIVLDSTGVVSKTPVKEQIELLKSIVAAYKGANHEPSVVQVSWGELLFYGRLLQIDIDYTLFSPNGDPLRAKIKLEFVDFQSTSEITKEAGLESPDLTHLIEVKAGDTLPSLCYRIYRDSSYYLAIAKVNRLSSFRCIQPGQMLRFPPLV